MRRILYYSLLCLLWVSVNSCKDDEASQPPTPTLNESTSRKTGLYNSTEFSFLVEQVGSNAMSVLPYGTDHPNDPGILIPASSFVNGVATVKFIYGKVGTFNAVAVANNHTGGGESVKNSYSAPYVVTITSDHTGISDFTFTKTTKNNLGDKVITTISTSTQVDTVAHTVDVVVPFGTKVNQLETTFTASDFATVTAGSTALVSGTTVVDYTNPVTITVKSQDGLKTKDWTVTVHVTPAEKTNMFKSVAAKNATTDKTLAGRVLGVDVDSAANHIVIYDVLGKTQASMKAVSIDYALKGKFAYAEIGAGISPGPKLVAKDTFDLSADNLKVTVVPQDSMLAAPDGKKTFDVFYRQAPNMTAHFIKDSINADPLNPKIDVTPVDFAGTAIILPGMSKFLGASFSFDVGTTGATIGQIIATNQFISTKHLGDRDITAPGTIVNYTKPVNLRVQVMNSNGVTFWATYTITVTTGKQ